jgi:hypothetical protein
MRCCCCCLVDADECLLPAADALDGESADGSRSSSLRQADDDFFTADGEDEDVDCDVLDLGGVAADAGPVVDCNGGDGGVDVIAERIVQSC